MVCGFCCQVMSGKIFHLHKHAHSIHLCGRWPCPVCGCCHEATEKGNLRKHVCHLHPDGVLHKNPLSIRGCRRHVRPPAVVAAAEWHDVESVVPVIRDPDVLDDDDDVLELSCGMSGCDVVCDSHSLLKRHVRRHHSAVHSSFVGDVELCGVGWMCGWCCGHFGSRRVRDGHVRSVHLGERWPCPWSGCVYEATQKGHLRSHVHGRHLHDVEFVCDRDGCDRHFKSSSGLRVHLARDHEGIRWRCLMCVGGGGVGEVCGCVFGIRDNAARHCRTVHGVSEVVASGVHLCRFKLGEEEDDDDDGDVSCR